MELIDTHCHLDFSVFDEDRETVLSGSRSRGVVGFVIPAVERKTWNALLSFCANQSDCYFALGLHPMFVHKHAIEDLAVLETLLETVRPIAIGEIGLDFYKESLDREKQIVLFERQLKIAREVELPVILHVRKEHNEVLQCLKKTPVVGGIAHAFNGSFEQAEQYARMGFKLGFGGMLTYERSSKLRQLAKRLPKESIVLEANAPDMVVSQHRGERNSPEYIVHSLQALADLREETPDEVAAWTTENAKQVLSI